MDDCWKNHGEYAADREPFCVKVKAVLDAVCIHDVPDASPPTKALAPWFAPTNIETRKHLISTYQRVADYITSAVATAMGQRRYRAVLPRPATDRRLQIEI